MTAKKREKRKQSSRKREQLTKRIVTFVVIIGVAAGLYFLLSSVATGRPGYGVVDAGNGHTPTCTPQFNTRPPTSGCHDPSIVSYQIYDEPIDDKLQTHNLEHGAVIIQYRRSGIPAEDDQLVQDLTDLVNRLKNQDSKYCRLILAPYGVGFAAPSVDALKDKASGKKIALTAWTRIDLLDGYDEERIIGFVNAFINSGPERVNDCN